MVTCHARANHPLALYISINGVTIYNHFTIFRNVRCRSAVFQRGFDNYARAVLEGRFAGCVVKVNAFGIEVQRISDVQHGSYVIFITCHVYGIVSCVYKKTRLLLNRGTRAQDTQGAVLDTKTSQPGYRCNFYVLYSKQLDFYVTAFRNSYPAVYKTENNRKWYQDIAKESKYNGIYNHGQ